MLRLVLCGWMLAGLSSPASAAVLYSAFSAFGANSWSSGSSVDIFGGWIGSNVGQVHVGGSSTFLGAMGGADYDSGTGVLNTGNLVFSTLIHLGGNSVLTGNADAGGNITSGTGVTVTGTLTAGGSVSLGSGSSAGNIIASGSPAPFVPVILPAPRTFTAGASDISVGSTPITLAPGSYRDLTFSGSGRTLNLTSGTYVFNSVNVTGNATINYTYTGAPIVIYVVNTFVTASGLDFTLNGNTFGSVDTSLLDDIYLEAHGAVTLGGNNEWLGTIYTPNSNLTVNSGGLIKGALWAAGNLSLGGNTQLNFYPSSLIETPEPDTFFLLAIGLLGIKLGHSCRRSCRRSCRDVR